MAYTNKTLKDGAGADFSAAVWTPGRGAAAESAPVVLSTEDLAALGDVAETAPADDTASSGLNGRLQRIAQRLTSVIAALPSLVLGRSLTEPLGQPSVARQQAVTISSASVTLTMTCRRVSIVARTCDMRYTVGTGAQTADATTSHFLAAGERLDLAVPANGVIGAIRASAATADGALEITELV